MITRPLLGLVVALGAGAAAAEAPQPLAWTAWTDPVEHAFSVEVPSGWQVTGGLQRPSPGDTRAVVELRSPDGTMQVGLGDAAAPNFVLPTHMSAAIGQSEGSPAGNGLLIASYRTGEAFAVEYGQRVFGRDCGHPVTLLHHDAQPAKPTPDSAVPNSTSAAGQAVFRCDDPAHGFYAVATAQTQLMPFPGMEGGLWSPLLIARAAATTQAGGALAMTVLNHVTGTFRVDPAWQAAQLEAQRRALTQTGPAPAVRPTPSPQDDVAEYRRKTLDEMNHVKTLAGERQARNFHNYITDTQPLIDPATGTRYEAPSGYTTYQAVPGGVIGSMGGGVSGGTDLEKNDQ